MKILVLYYSRTGNTEKMAKAVAEGAKSVQGATVELSYSVSVEELGNFDAILVGSATYHHDMPVGFKSFFEEVAVKNISLKGKVGAGFGSYAAHRMYMRSSISAQSWDSVPPAPE